MGKVTNSSRCPSCGAPSTDGSTCSRCTVRTSAVPNTPSWNYGRPSGILIEGKYRLLNEIGRGGMGTVFQAHDESLDRTVGIKFLLPELQAEQILVDRFRREARAMASVRHENVLQIFSFGQYGSSHFFVMEYIEGRTAEEILEQAQERKEFIPVHLVLKILQQSAAGLAAVHRAGVVHRDIKPGNIMVEADTQRAVIMDFGIGKRYHSTDKRRTQAPCGTPAYMAPEVVTGKEITAEEDHLSDVYAFGITAFELLTGSLPFDAENWVDLCVKHVTEQPPLPSSLRKGIPEYLDKIIHKCLAKVPQERYLSCTDLRDDLVSALEQLELHKSATPLPSDRPRPKSMSLVHDGDRETVTSTRIIVSDPDAAFRFTVYQCAQDTVDGCRFQAAKTNTKAFQLALQTPPFLMVATLDDPGLNGLELAASLWGNRELENVRLVLTARHVTRDEQRMLEGMGVYRVLLKPVETKTLIELLRAIFKNSGDRKRTSSQGA